MSQYPVSFCTDRLTIESWRIDQPDQWPPASLADEVRSVLTPGVTKWLRPEWSGEYDGQRTLAWIREQDAEGPVLSVRLTADSTLIGLLLISEPEEAAATPELRIGYMLAESAWGSGFATEMLKGCVEWCRRERSPCRLLAGVDPANEPSIKVLQKCGFQLMPGMGNAAVQWYSLDILPNPEH